MGGQVESPLKKALPQHVNPTVGSQSHSISHEVPGKSAWKWILAPLVISVSTLLFRKSKPSTQPLAPNLKSKCDSSFM